jgi:Holliday junction resolvase RusA-like endonuclease
MSIHALEDLMEVRSAFGRSIAFVITGEPPAQKRHRLHARFRRFIPPVFYDPSAAHKVRYKALVNDAMLQYELGNAPFFNADEPITLEVRFVLARRVQDWRFLGGTAVLRPSAQTFPRGKDVDNLLKLLMDALQGPIYSNDNTITKVIVSKLFSQTPNATGWTEVQLGTSSEAPPPLASRGIWA